MEIKYIFTEKEKQLIRLLRAYHNQYAEDGKFEYLIKTYKEQLAIFHNAGFFHQVNFSNMFKRPAIYRLSELGFNTFKTIENEKTR